MHDVHGRISAYGVAGSGRVPILQCTTGNAQNRTQLKGHGHDDSECCCHGSPGPGCRRRRADHRRGATGPGLEEVPGLPRARVDLKALTDRQLADVGLTRATVEEAARRAVYGR